MDVSDWLLQLVPQHSISTAADDLLKLLPFSTVTFSIFHFRYLFRQVQSYNKEVSHAVGCFHIGPYIKPEHWAVVDQGHDIRDDIKTAG